MCCFLTDLFCFVSNQVIKCVHPFYYHSVVSNYVTRTPIVGAARCAGVLIAQDNGFWSKHNLETLAR